MTEQSSYDMELDIATFLLLVPPFDFDAVVNHAWSEPFSIRHEPEMAKGRILYKHTDAGERVRATLCAAESPPEKIYNHTMADLGTQPCSCIFIDGILDWTLSLDHPFVVGLLEALRPFMREPPGAKLVSPGYFFCSAQLRDGYSFGDMTLHHALVSTNGTSYLWNDENGLSARIFPTGMQIVSPLVFSRDEAIDLFDRVVRHTVHHTP